MPALTPRLNKDQFFARNEAGDVFELPLADAAEARGAASRTCKCTAHGNLPGHCRGLDAHGKIYRLPVDVSISSHGYIAPMGTAVHLQGLQAQLPGSRREAILCAHLEACAEAEVAQ